jgi:ABC-type proline/glycine betaine transport system permease subunit
MSPANIIFVSSPHLEIIEKLSDQLGTTSNQVFEVLTKTNQMFISGIHNIVWAVFCLIVIIGLIYLIKLVRVYLYSMGENISYSNQEMLTLAMLVSGICIIIFTFALFVNINSAIGNFYNPQYYALKEIVDLIKK